MFDRVLNTTLWTCVGKLETIEFIRVMNNSLSSYTSNVFYTVRIALELLNKDNSLSLHSHRNLQNSLFQMHEGLVSTSLKVFLIKETNFLFTTEVKVYLF